MLGAMAILARHILAAALFAAMAASPASAGGGGSSAPSGPSNRVQASFTLNGEEEHGEEEAEHGGENPRAIVLPSMALPAFRDGVLENYLFVSVRLIAADGVDAWRMRERAHYMRDAMIRAAHRRSVARADNVTEVDEEAAREVFREGLLEVVDAEDIARIDIIAVDSRRSYNH